MYKIIVKRCGEDKVVQIKFYESIIDFLKQGLDFYNRTHNSDCWVNLTKKIFICYLFKLNIKTMKYEKLTKKEIEEFKKGMGR